MFVGIFAWFGSGGSGEDHSDHPEYNNSRDNENCTGDPTVAEDVENGIEDWKNVHGYLDSSEETDSQNPPRKGWW